MHTRWGGQLQQRVTTRPAAPICRMVHAAACRALCNGAGRHSVGMWVACQHAASAQLVRRARRRGCVAVRRFRTDAAAAPAAHGPPAGAAAGRLGAHASTAPSRAVRRGSTLAPDSYHSALTHTCSLHATTLCNGNVTLRFIGRWLTIASCLSQWLVSTRRDGAAWQHLHLPDPGESQGARPTAGRPAHGRRP